MTRIAPSRQTLPDAGGWRRWRDRLRGSLRSPDIATFQSDPMEIEEGPLPLAARATLYTTALLILAAIVWASVSRIDEVVVASGRVVTNAANVVVGPLETSVVRSIDVHPGDILAAGAPLAHLDPTFTDADAGQLEQRKQSLQAQVDRLRAEMAGDTSVAGAAAGPEQRLQATLAQERHNQYDAKLRSYDQHIAGIAASIDSRRNEVKLLQRRHGVLLEVEAMRDELMKSGSGSKLNALQARDARLEVERSQDTAINSLTELDHQMDETRAEREAFIKKWREDVAQELVTAERDLSSAAEQLAKAARRREMVVVSAPVESILLEIGPYSVGSVVREAERMFTLVRTNVPMEIDATIPAADVARFSPGATVRLKFDAFPYQRHGTLPGTVTVISQDSFQPQERETGGEAARSAHPVYRVRIRIDGAELRDVPANFHLIPGMTVTAEIKVGSRRIISYLLYPLIRGLDESFREP